MTRPRPSLGTDDAARLTKAEVYRQLADSERAAQVLTATFEPAVEVVAQRLRELVRARDQRVAKILSNDPGER